MTTNFASDPAAQADFSSLYTDAAAATAPDPAQALFDSLAAAAKAAAAATPVAPGGAVSTPAATAPAAAPASAAAAPAAASPAPQQSPDQTAMLARLAPKGITSLDQLKGKSDVELHKLSQDVVQYEMRQKSLEQFFKKNPDGTYDLTQGPDGNPTGLDAAGKVVPAAGAAPAAPVAAPAIAPAKKPAPKPAVKTKVVAKKLATKRPAAKKSPVRVKQAPAKKPAPKPVMQTKNYHAVGWKPLT